MLHTQPAPQSAFHAGLRLQRFSPDYAGMVARWVQGPDELFWLAPSADPPLTAEKVAAWTRLSGNPFLLFEEAEGPIGYAELNPMRDSPSQYWIGHLVLDPAQRGFGRGEAFVRLLLDHAFTGQRARSVSLIVFPDNRAAIRTYLRAGFERQADQYHTFGRSNRKQRMLHLVQKNPGRGRPTS
jgi:RimJ/RimL family protein N-acetyltransferase